MLMWHDRVSLCVKSVRLSFNIIEINIMESTLWKLKETSHTHTHYIQCLDPLRDFYPQITLFTYINHHHKRN